MKLLFLVILGLTFNEFLSENVLEKNNEALSRQKRVSLKEMDSGTGNKNFSGNSYQFPILIPKYENNSDVDNKQRTPKWGTCLLYMEGITVVVINHNKAATNGQKAVSAVIDGTNNIGGAGKSPNNSMWIYNPDSSMDCTIKDASGNTTNALYFHIKIDPTKGKGVDGLDGDQVAFTVNALEFQLNFVLKSPYVWYLDNIQLYDIKITKGTTGYLPDDITIDNFPANATISSPLTKDIHGMYGYSYGCSATPGIFFESDKKYAIGLQFNNFQVDLCNIYYNNGTDDKHPKGVQFKATVNDCVPTFSVGSWMSIIASLVLAAVFFFGFLMLNSIQTMDRFDDPKAKQIIINTKE